jgi:sigma-70-like protein
VLRYYNRMSYSQIAEALNMPLSAVRVRIFRAKRFLRCNLRRSHRADVLARMGPERKNDRFAMNTLQRFNAPVSADTATLHPLSASSGFYVANSNVSSQHWPC